MLARAGPGELRNVSCEPDVQNAAPSLQKPPHTAASSRKAISDPAGLVPCLSPRLRRLPLVRGGGTRRSLCPDPACSARARLQTDQECGSGRQQEDAGERTRVTGALAMPLAPDSRCCFQVFTARRGAEGTGCVFQGNQREVRRSHGLGHHRHKAVSTVSQRRLQVSPNGLCESPS